MKPVRIMPGQPTEKIPVGGSRFWGNPDLPSDVEYPVYTGADGQVWEYQFICQINLAECGKIMPSVLPAKGLLSFFARIDHYLGHDDDDCGISGYISEPEDVKVMYFPEITDDFEEVELLDEDDNPLNPPEMTVAFGPVDDSLCDDHALLAEPTHREWETWDPPYEDWQILLQVDSFDGDGFNLNFMDCGVLDFLISPEALRRADFSDVRAIVLST